MTLFLISLVALIAGYFIYGTIVERIIGVDPSRKTPATTKADGVDFVPMPTWKVYLIQFLNIAGIGPIFGAIMGIEYGPSAFLWIVLGTIFAGGVHDFVSGMISVRTGGQSLPGIIREQLGVSAERFMIVFVLILLLMVVAVFVVTPAGLLANMTPGINIDFKAFILDSRTFWIGIIFIYYILATLLPIDKLIGNLYPVFGAALLFMAVGLIAYMIGTGADIPTGISEGLGDRMPNPTISPIFPMMFVSIACGAISGFHATQSPMMARCLKNERHARMVFYGAMVSEGIVALVWAAAAITFCKGYRGLEQFLAANNNDAGFVVSTICNNWLGIVGGVLAILGVIAAPITTGDTAMRSMRLTVADALKIDQKPLIKRLGVMLPMVLAAFFMMQIDFSVLWRYFGWSNQSLSIFTLWASSVYLLKNGRNYIITLIPALFMTVVCISYICFAPLGVPTGGIGLPYDVSVGLGLLVAIVFLGMFIRFRNNFAKAAKL